jgi:hypothetical protein
MEEVVEVEVEGMEVAAAELLPAFRTGAEAAAGSATPFR